MHPTPDLTGAKVPGPTPPAAVDARRVRRDRLELAVFVLLLVPSLLPVVVASVAPRAFALTAVVTILHDVALVALVQYFLWRNGERPSAVGWTRRHAGREALIGVVLYPPMFLAILYLQTLLHALGLSTAPPSEAFLLPRSSADLVLAFVLVVVVAWSEETVFRGYLLLRLRSVSHSTAIAVLASSLLFASGHAYEGSAGVVLVGLMGVLFALVYLWRRSLVAPVVMHFLQDFLGIVLVPLLGSHR